MPDDTPWLNDPDFRNLPLAEKHKFMLQADPDYKGLPTKEQAKALDAIHYGSLGQISGEGISLKGAPGAALSYAAKIPGSLLQSVDPTRGLSGAALTGIGINPRKGTVGERMGEVPLAGASKEAQFEYQRSRQAGSNPVAATASAGIAGIGSLFGASAERGYQQAQQGEGGKIIGEAAVPAAMAAAPLVGEAARATGIPGKVVEGISTGLRTEEGYGPVKPGVSAAAKVVGMGAGHYTGIPGLGELGGYLIAPEAAEMLIPRRKGGLPSIPAESPESIQAGIQQRQAAYAEMNEAFAKESQKRAAAHAEMEQDFADRRQVAAKDLEKRLNSAETQRQKEITDWAKLDKVSDADHAAFQDRIGEIEAERQSALADMEKLKQQHAQSLMKRGAEQDAMDAAHSKRLADIESDRQGALADQERLIQQHAAALNQRGATKGGKAALKAPPPSPFAGMTSTAAPIGSAELPAVPQGSPTLFPQVQRPGGFAPPPTPEPVVTAPEPAGGPLSRPTIGSQVAAKEKTSLLSRGTELYEPGREPNVNSVADMKQINDMTNWKKPRLERAAQNGDRFAAFVLRKLSGQAAIRP